MKPAKAILFLQNRRQISFNRTIARDCLLFFFIVLPPYLEYLALIRGSMKAYIRSPRMRMILYSVAKITEVAPAPETPAEAPKEAKSAKIDVLVDD